MSMPAIFIAICRVGLIAAMCFAAVGVKADDDSRYRSLVRVVDRNLGHAHFTRGVNMCTFLALHDAATSADVPVLQAMLKDRDSVIRLAAIYGLAIMGDAGVTALRGGVMPSDRVKAEDAIRESSDILAGIARYRKDRSCPIRR